MTDAGNRRGFLREAFFGAARTTVDAATGMHSAQTEIKKAVLPGLFDRTEALDADDATSFAIATEEPTRPAAATSRVTSRDEFLELADTCGLGGRSQDLCEAVRRSVRLTLDETAGAVGGRSRIGGDPDLPADGEWPTRQDDRLAFLAQLDLTALGSVDPELDLPATGRLLLFYDVGQEPGDDPVDLEATRVLYVDDDVPTVTRAADTEPFVADRPVRLSGELVLPRPWSARVQSLSLDAHETQAWSELRELLADHQGVEVSRSSVQAIHRIHGYPDDTRGDMPLACELLSQGLALTDTPAYANPDARIAELTMSRWRLLLQLSSDDDLGFSWGTGHQRLYFWIADDDLRAKDFSRVVGLLR